jgi:hypothetical protein
MITKVFLQSIILYLTFSLAHCFFIPTKEQAEKIKQQKKLCLEILTPVANALQVYYQEHQKFPRKLDELVPDYIEALPVELTNPEMRSDLLKDIMFRYNDQTVFLHADESILAKYKFKDLPKEVWTSWELTQKAIADFRQENGFYPETLDELVPNYLESHPHEWIEKSTLPNDLKAIKYKYYILEEFGFESTDSPTGFDGCRWNVKKADWLCEGWF